MNAHTPGPWVLQQDATWPWTYRVYGAGGLPVIDYSLYTYTTNDSRETANERPGNQETHANTRLIAAAPAMLEALQGIASLQNTEENEWDGVERLIPQMCDIAREAIKKATGAA